MALCQNDNGTLVGRYARLYLANGCADTEPLEDDWKLLGPMTSKGVDFSPNTVTSDADDTGGFVVSLVTNSDLTISGEGEVRHSDKADEYGIHHLISMYVTEQKAMRQPTLWVRLVTGSTVITMYGVLTALSWDAGTSDIITFSVEFHPADSGTVDVMSLEDLTLTTNLPANKTVAPNATLTLGPVVPAGGTAPYTYVWKKGGTVISGANTATYTKATAAAGDAGTYTVTVTDAATVPDSVVSTPCVVTVT